MPGHDLTYGLCQICLGPLTDDNIYEDEDGADWDHHKGICAYLAGVVAEEHQVENDRLIALIHTAPCGTPTFAARKRYYDWLKTLGLEDHFRPNTRN
jgi:hypothetical protein